MKFLADECLDGRLITGLRSAGHDVSAVRDSSRGSPDGAVMAAATRERRVLATEDKGFGDLILRHGFDLPGLILVRYAQVDVGAVLDRLRASSMSTGDRLHAMHVVVPPERVRVRGLGAERAAAS